MWTAAFKSPDPETIFHVHGVTGVYVSVINHINEMLLTAARERGLEVMAGEQKPSMSELYDAVKADGGLTASQVERLKEMNWARNELEHSSPTITAEQAYDAIVMLQKTAKPVLQNYWRWLQANGLEHLLTGAES